MSGGLKMLNSEISPSKDNLIFSSIEDIHTHMVVDVDISSNKKPEYDKISTSRNNSLNKVKAKDYQTGEQVNGNRQQNLLLAQQQAAMISNKDGKKGDENGIGFQSHNNHPTKGNEIEVEDEEGQTDLEEFENGPQIVTVDDEIDSRRTSCCSFFGVSWPIKSFAEC
jgi:hypothetical protein